jgi:tRNA 2-thiouridine synthesizing protein A
MRSGTTGGHDGGREGARVTGRRVRLFGRGPLNGTRGADRRADGPGADAGSAPFPGAERPVVPPPGLAPALTIDALGRKCPIPIIMLAERIRDVPMGAVVAVLADDPAAYTDVPSWCALKAQEFAGCQELARGWALYIRRTI